MLPIAETKIEALLVYRRFVFPSTKCTSHWLISGNQVAPSHEVLKTMFGLGLNLSTVDSMSASHTKEQSIH